MKTVQLINKLLSLFGEKNKSRAIHAALYIKDFQGREHVETLGNLNPDKTIYCIRRNKTNRKDGLLSIFQYVMARIDYAHRHNLIPFVDVDNVKQAAGYSMFDNYFKVKNTLTRDEVYHSKHVLFSGWNSKWITPGWGSYMNCEYNEEKRRLFDEYIDFTDEVKACCEKVLTTINPNNCLGLYLRGTDYMKMRPYGHPIQPNISDVKNEVSRILNEENLPYIFLVTEDYNIVQQAKDLYGKKVLTIDGDMYWENYDGGYLRNTIENNFNLDSANMIYLVKEIVLSKCSALVAGRTSGSSFACALNGGQYKQKYIFDKGYYE